MTPTLITARVSRLTLNINPTTSFATARATYSTRKNIFWRRKRRGGLLRLIFSPIRAARAGSNNGTHHKLACFSMQFSTKFGSFPLTLSSSSRKNGVRSAKITSWESVQGSSATRGGCTPKACVGLKFRGARTKPKCWRKLPLQSIWVRIKSPTSGKRFL